MARTLSGVVVSNKNDKTIVVNIETRKTHPIYKKQYSVGNRLSAHDEKNEANVGDKVTIVETRPLSATKRFKLLTVDSKAGVAFIDDSARENAGDSK